MKLREMIGRKVLLLSVACDVIGSDTGVRYSVDGVRLYRRLEDAVTDAPRTSERFCAVYPPLLLQHSLARRLVCMSDGMADCRYEFR